MYVLVLKGKFLMLDVKLLLSYYKEKKSIKVVNKLKERTLIRINYTTDILYTALLEQYQLFM